jgi:tRNA nucleotidyltransferase (CCA-adding enzyme)
MRDELILILKELKPFGSIKQLGDLGALSFISTKLKVGKSTQVLFKSIAKEIAWFVKNFPTRRQLDAWLIYFAGLLESLVLPEVKTIIHRFTLPKGDQKRMIDYFQERKKLLALLTSKKQMSPEQIFLLLEPLSYETIISLGATTPNKNLKKCLADFFKNYNGMRLCVSGDDLSNLGVLPGHEYQKIFAKVLAAKLSGRLKNRQSELALIKKLVLVK